MAMKANPTPSPAARRGVPTLPAAPRRGVIAATVLLLVTACVPAAPPPPAPPAPPRPRPAPAPLPPAPADWRDAPYTPGTWRHATEGGRSVARYGVPGRETVAMLACDRAAGTTILWRTGSAAGAVPLAVTTTGTRRILDAGPETAGGVSARIAPRDALLDQIAFSRGRFMLEVPGNAPLYLPNWPELSRVIEDCR